MRYSSFRSPERPERVKPKLTPVVPRPGVHMQQCGEDFSARLPALHRPPREPASKIRESARGEDCMVRIVGACNARPETTVWSHWPGIDGGRGMGIKSLDVCGAYTCSACHDVIDGRRGLPPGASRTSIELDWFYGHLRSLVRLKEKGLIA